MAQEIGVQWRVVGTVLLDDKNGTIIPALAQQFGNNAHDITMEILSRWMQGKGIECTWHALIDALKKPCKTLAKTMKETLTEEEATDIEPGKYMMQCIICQEIFPFETFCG